jgi:hypothetical protein
MGRSVLIMGRPGKMTTIENIGLFRRPSVPQTEGLLQPFGEFGATPDRVRLVNETAPGVHPAKARPAQRAAASNIRRTQSKGWGRARITLAHRPLWHGRKPITKSARPIWLFRSLTRGRAPDKSGHVLVNYLVNHRNRTPRVRTAARSPSARGRRMTTRLDNSRATGWFSLPLFNVRLDCSR